MSQEIPGRTKIVTGKTNSIHSTNGADDRLLNNNPLMPDIPFNLDLLLRLPKQQPIKQNRTQNIQEINPKSNINLDFEENLPFQEGIMSETFPNPKELGDLISKENLVHNTCQTNRYRQNTRSNTKESIKRHPFVCGN